MATKTFKIGEYCKGGIITAVATKTKVTIIAKDWDYSAGTRKGSDQSGATEFDRREVSTSSSSARQELQDFLNDLTTYYYAVQVLDWVESKTKFTNAYFW